jgi:multidrug efflux pump subunit AcrA (membrane-fusion protein)
VLTDLSALQVTADVAEADAAKVKTGQTASVTFSAADLTTSGTVTAIDVQETVSNNVVQYGVTVTLDEAPSTLRLGQTASVTITTDSKQGVLSVPTNAITTTGDVSTVTVRRDGTDRVTVVQLGIAGDTRTEVVSGVQEGDVLVLPTTTGGGSGGFTFPGGGVPGGGLGGGLGR